MSLLCCKVQTLILNSNLQVCSKRCQNFLKYYYINGYWSSRLTAVVESKRYNDRTMWHLTNSTTALKDQMNHFHNTTWPLLRKKLTEVITKRIVYTYVALYKFYLPDCHRVFDETPIISNVSYSKTLSCWGYMALIISKTSAECDQYMLMTDVWGYHKHIGGEREKGKH